MEAYRHIGIVRFNVRRNLRESDARHIREMRAVALEHELPLRDVLVHMTQIAEAHRRRKLVHLSVAADRRDLLLPEDTEVFQLVELLHQRWIRFSGRDGTTLDGIKDLRRMEGKHRGITEGADPLSVQLLAEGMGGIIDDLQMMAIRNLLNPVNVADVSIDMHRHDRAGALGDQGLELIDIDRIVPHVDITEDRREAVPHDCMGCGGEGKRCRDDLAMEVHRLQQKLQRTVSVHEELHGADLQIVLKLRPKRLVVLAHIGKPRRVPDMLQQLLILGKRRQTGARDVDDF